MQQMLVFTSTQNSLYCTCRLPQSTAAIIGCRNCSNVASLKRLKLDFFIFFLDIVKKNSVSETTYTCITRTFTSNIIFRTQMSLYNISFFSSSFSSSSASLTPEHQKCWVQNSHPYVGNSLVLSFCLNVSSTYFVCFFAGKTKGAQCTSCWKPFVGARAIG